MPSIGTLFNNSRLIAKTVNRIIIEPEGVNLRDWLTEGKLLKSPGGDCLSSATLLVKGKHVPTYGIDGRCYGLLLDADKSYVYDVNLTDANTNRDDKLEKRATRKGIDLLHANTQNLKTLDQLSDEIKGGKDGQMNEILLDAWQESVVGLYVRKVDLTKASPQALKHYYQSLLEIKLIQKYLIQALEFPEPLTLCQYSETEGRLIQFPSDNDLYAYANMNGLNKKTQPELFRLLSDDHVFKPIPQPITVGEYLANYEPQDDMRRVGVAVVTQLVARFDPFDARPVSAQSILGEPVDSIIGVNAETIEEVIASCLSATKDNTSSTSAELTVSDKKASFFSSSSTVSKDKDFEMTVENTTKQNSSQ